MSRVGRFLIGLVLLTAWYGAYVMYVLRAKSRRWWA
jgi:hypothetical protein